MITLYSPNPGADGVAEDVRATLNSYSTTRFPELEIELLKGDKKATAEEKANALILSPTVNLLVVELLRMPNPNGEGASVLVYKTRLRIGSKIYTAICYTSKTRNAGELGLVSLLKKDLGYLGENVGTETTLGIWQSLLQVDRLNRFHF